MDERARLLRAWLEGEGKRQRRGITLQPGVGDSLGRGLYQLQVCLVAGTLAIGLLVCSLATSRQQTYRVGVVEQLRSMGYRMAVDLECLDNSR
jgi:hypothetical protein